MNLSVSCFRNQTKYDGEIHKGTTCVSGPSGVGKSTLMASLIWCLTGDYKPNTNAHVTIRVHRAPHGWVTITRAKNPIRLVVQIGQVELLNASAQAWIDEYMSCSYVAQNGWDSFVCASGSERRMMMERSCHFYSMDVVGLENKIKELVQTSIELASKLITPLLPRDPRPPVLDTLDIESRYKTNYDKLVVVKHQAAEAERMLGQVESAKLKLVTLGAKKAEYKLNKGRLETIKRIESTTKLATRVECSVCSSPCLTCTEDGPAAKKYKPTKPSTGDTRRNRTIEEVQELKELKSLVQDLEDPSDEIKRLEKIVSRYEGMNPPDKQVVIEAESAYETVRIARAWTLYDQSLASFNQTCQTIQDIETIKSVWVECKSNILLQAAHNLQVKVNKILARFFAPESLEIKIEKGTNRAEPFFDLKITVNQQERQLRELSGGERSRLSVAFALIQAKHILVLDESFSGLDMITLERCMNVLKNYTSSTLEWCIIVSHNSVQGVFDHLLPLS